MRNTGLVEVQARIKIAGRNISNVRYADDTTLMAESKEELKSLMMKEESLKMSLKLNIQKAKIMASLPITLRIFQFVVIHTAKGFSIVNEAEIDVFLEFPCFIYGTISSVQFSHSVMSDSLRQASLSITNSWYSGC